MRSGVVWVSPGWTQSVQPMSNLHVKVKVALLAQQQQITKPFKLRTASGILSARQCRQSFTLNGIWKSMRLVA